MGSQDQILRLTDTAIAHVKKIRERENFAGRGLRVSVMLGGCSGYSYKLDFGDETAILQQLEGTVIDYVSELQGASFRFSNPKATGTCGCGTSFSA